MKVNKIIVSKKSFNSTDPYAIISSNISVVNVLIDEGVKVDQIHPGSLASYYVDYYLAQVNNGNFSQFVFNSKWSSKLNKIIKEGLKKVGAPKHLEYFKSQEEKVKKLSKKELTNFFKSQYFGKNPTRDKLNNRAFFNIKEDLVELNSKFLRNHKDLKVLSVKDMYLEVEKMLGKKIAR